MASTKSNLCDLSMTAGVVVYKYVFLLLLQETQILGHTCVEHNKVSPKKKQSGPWLRAMDGNKSKLLHVTSYNKYEILPRELFRTVFVSLKSPLWQFILGLYFKTVI